MTPSGSEPHPDRVAVIGTGIQGTAIVDRLVAAGWIPTVHDRVDAQTLRCLALGAKAVSSPAEAIAAADLVLLVLPAGDTPLQVLSESLTLHALQPRHLVLQLGSCSVAATHRMAALVRGRGARFAECVLAGPIATVLDASCELLFGGEAEDEARARPVVGCFGKLRAVGGVGSASAFNFAALTQVYATLQGFYLACGQIERSGLDIEQYLDFVRNGVAGHPGAVMADFLWPAHLRKRAYPLIGPVQVRNDCSLEETRLMAQRARELNLHTGLIDALASTQAAAARRDAGADWSSVYDELVRPRPLLSGREEPADEAAFAAAEAAARRLREGGFMAASHVGGSTPTGGEQPEQPKDEATHQDHSLFRLRKLQVRDGMNARVARITEDATIGDVAELLAVTQASDIAVVDRTRHFIGVVSEGDVIRALIPDFDEVLLARGSLADAGALFLETAQRVRGEPITRLIIRNPLTLGPEDDLLRAAVIMVEKMIRRLPVVEDGRFLGTLSRGDLCWVLTGANS